jgi:hypothetical protein
MHSHVIDAKDAQELKRQIFDLAESMGYQPRARVEHNVAPGSPNAGASVAVPSSAAPIANAGPASSSLTARNDVHDNAVDDAAAEEDVISAGALKAEVKKGRGRPKKEDQPVPAPAQEKVQEEFDPFDTTPAKAASAATFEDVKQALTQVNLKRGLPAAKQILKAAGASRLGEIKPQDYASFIAACEKAIA